MARSHRRINVEAQLIRQLFDEATELEALGDELSLRRAEATRLSAVNALAKSDIADVEAVYAEASKAVPFTAAEETKRDKDEAAAAALAVTDAASAAERQTLIGKLTAGTASVEETQAALAKLLGGDA